MERAKTMISKMGNLAETVAGKKVDEGQLAIYWLSQAGFVFKTSSGKIVYIDPYFSDVVERVLGFKRMMPCPIDPEEVEADLIICTHEHLDHMDIDALPIIARKSKSTKFAGPVECAREFHNMGIPDVQCILLEEGGSSALDGVGIEGVYADHGDLAPDALGVVLDLDGVKVYQTGDTAYRPKQFRRAIEMRPDVLIPCINGRFGNMNAEEAALLAQAASPHLVIASHFWMFVEHDGDPALFLQSCSQLAPNVKAIVMKPGEEYMFQNA